MSISDVTSECKKIAEEHGFTINTTDLTLNVPTALALIHTEVSETLQEYRKGNHVGEELADIIIRIFHLSETLEIDIEKEIREKMEKNKKRSYKHGKLV